MKTRMTRYPRNTVNAALWITYPRIGRSRRLNERANSAQGYRSRPESALGCSRPRAVVVLSRGDKTPMELFSAGIREMPANLSDADKALAMNPASTLQGRESSVVRKSPGSFRR